MSHDPWRVLVVDDDPHWRTLVAEILADEECVVSAVATPPADLAGFDVAVLDLDLDPDVGGDRGGLAVLERLAATGARCVFLSGVGDPAVAAEIERHPNVTGLMSKPAFNRVAFRDLVRRARAEAPQRPNVLIVEDHPQWRGLYEDVLAEAGYDLHFAVSYGEARGWLQRVGFALAIVDLNLASSTAPEANRDGFFLLRATGQRGVPTIVVSALGAPEDIDRAYDEFGVFTFVEKESFDRRNFMRLVADAVASRPANAPAPETSDGPAPSLDPLTPREREVLALLVQGHTNRQIAEALLITPNTVKKHVDHVLQKLNVSTRAGAVAAAMRAGLSASQ